MVDIVLIYPFFRKIFDKSPFRFPPLGIGYIASILRQKNYSVEIFDGTFRNREEMLKEIELLKPRIVGIYSMYSMEDESFFFAKKLGNIVDLLVAGGPLPTVEPVKFLKWFDVVVIGEGENTVLEIVKSYHNDRELDKISGIKFKRNNKIVNTDLMNEVKDLDAIPFPARELFDNDLYKRYFKKHFGYTMTSMISSRGCPFTCDFCSKPVFGDTFRQRSPKNIVDEMQTIVNQGYETKIHYQEDFEDRMTISWND